ncbi:hypothetical protein NQ317_016762 [Molorchus minor]|uniref:Uncharacterized protein n=1 Tax=Molorchus minor TaxID=1323400 RepID=A0ABQ9JN60_9CUCU|nr:hypothetical protein NQ317_016762 [Molorchus minor]
MITATLLNTQKGKTSAMNFNLKISGISKMDDRRVADYFVVAGLPEIPEPLDDTTLSEGGNLKS